MPSLAPERSCSRWPVTSSVWLTDHPDWAKRFVAGITVEHLGCTRWGNDLETGTYGRMPGYEWGATYTCQREGSLAATNLEESAYLAAVRAVNRAAHRFSPWLLCSPALINTLHRLDRAPTGFL